MSEKNGREAVLIVGAGIAGIQSALDMANSGFKVYLLEKSTVIGGAMAKLCKIFPTNGKALDQLAEKIGAIKNHPNITLITNASVETVRGKLGNFEVSIRKDPFRVTEGCNDCRECVKVCPIKPLDTYNEGLMLRTAIDIQNPKSIPLIYNIEKETPICQDTCPVHVNIRRYVGLIADGRFEEALKVVRDRNPLPAICGRVCHHPCESACNRGKQDEPIAIDALKRFIADYELKLRRGGKISYPESPKRGRNGKVAIIGAGPAGLTVAYDLALKGYESTIFEAASVPGGMLFLGIPEYRLPRDIIEAEIDYIKNLGVEIKCNTPIGKNLTIDDLLSQEYKAVFLGIGAHKGLKLNIPGEDEYEGFLDCIVFLRGVNLGDKSKPGKKVIVIGGGNSAIDSARVSLRLGSDEVYILYRRSRIEMPANSWEIDEAEKEGVKIMYLAAPIRIRGENGKVVGMQCTKMQLGKLDASGRRTPIPIPGSEFEIEADVIIPAISQEPDLSFLHENHSLKISRWNSFVINEDMETNKPSIFAGGDAVTGPATVIEAIAAGHRAAEAIVKYLQG